MYLIDLKEGALTIYFHRHQMHANKSSEVTSKNVFYKSAVLPTSIYPGSDVKATILREFSCCVSNLHQSLMHATRLSSTVTTAVVGQFNRYRYVLEFDCSTERCPEEGAAHGKESSRPYWFFSELLNDPMSNNNHVTLRRINPAIKSLEVNLREVDEWKVKNNARILSNRNLSSEYPNKILKNSIVTLSYELEMLLAPCKLGTLALPSIQVVVLIIVLTMF